MITYIIFPFICLMIILRYKGIFQKILIQNQSRRALTIISCKKRIKDRKQSYFHAQDPSRIYEPLSIKTESRTQRKQQPIKGK